MSIVDEIKEIALDITELKDVDTTEIIDFIQDFISSYPQKLTG